MFKNLFNKKRKEEPNPLDRTVRDLEQGYLFEYDLSTWEVKAVYEYDWGGNFFTREYKVSNGKETRYLAVEEDDELELVLSEKVKLKSIRSDLAKTIMDEKEPPESIAYKGKVFHLDEESPGYFRELPADDDDDWEEFVAWDYYDEEEEYCLTIEQWDHRSFEASYGKMLKEFEISEILPREQA